MGRYAQTFGKRLLGSQGIFDDIYRCLPRSSLYTGTYNQPDHAAQKAVGRDVKNEPVFVRMADPGRFFYRTTISCRAAVGFAKRVKGVKLWNQGRYLLHQRPVQPVVLGIKPSSLGRKRIFSQRYVVFITPLECIVPGVHRIGHREKILYRDGIGQYAVEPLQESRWKGPNGIEMSHIKPGMYAGIGAAAPGYFNGLPEDGRKRRFQGLLDGCGIGLSLPAAIGRTEVGEVEEVAHGTSNVKRRTSDVRRPTSGVWRLENMIVF